VINLSDKYIIFNNKNKISGLDFEKYLIKKDITKIKIETLKFQIREKEQSTKFIQKVRCGSYDDEIIILLLNQRTKA